MVEILGVWALDAWLYQGRSALGLVGRRAWEKEAGRSRPGATRGWRGGVGRRGEERDGKRRTGGQRIAESDGDEAEKERRRKRNRMGRCHVGPACKGAKEKRWRGEGWAG